MFGCVYVVEFDVMHVKIGFSAQPSQRINLLAAQSGKRVRFKWISPKIKNPMEVESKIHSALKDVRTFGEYFRIGFKDAVKIALPWCDQIVTDLDVDERRQKREAEGKEFIARLEHAFRPRLYAPNLLESRAGVAMKQTTVQLETRLEEMKAWENKNNMKDMLLVETVGGRNRFAFIHRSDTLQEVFAEFADL
jgi:hypothetical protein